MSFKLCCLGSLYTLRLVGRSDMSVVFASFTILVKADWEQCGNIRFTVIDLCALDIAACGSCDDRFILRWTDRFWAKTKFEQRLPQSSNISKTITNSTEVLLTLCCRCDYNLEAYTSLTYSGDARIMKTRTWAPIGRLGHDHNAVVTPHAYFDTSGFGMR